MASPKPIGRLIARYLDPSKRWDAANEKALRDLIREDESARAAYREAVTAHRLMVGADPQFPSGFEQGRMRDAVVAAATPAPRPAPQRFAVWAGLLAAGAAALLITVLPQDGGPLPVAPGLERDADLRTRGGESEERAVGLGLSGVPRTQPTAEYEIVASEGVHLGDFLRLYTTHQLAGPAHLFTFVLQPNRAPIWYAPMPPEETQSVPVTAGRAVMLEAEYAVDSERYAPGAAFALAIYSAHPVTLAALQPHLGDGLSAKPPEAMAKALAERLGLTAPSEVVAVPFTVLPPRPAAPDAP
ncbi:MAG: hypothetical protein ACPGU1_11220 [Myxococcota bacterium]